MIKLTNVADYKNFKLSYNKAVKNNQSTMQWNDKPVVISFAKYVLEYHSPKFEGIK